MSIKQIQGIVGVKQDGINGPKTKAAVKAWQSAHGLTPDGIVGPKTIAAMQGGGTAAPAAAAAPAINEAEMAQQYGFAQAVLNSDPELAGLFRQAVAGTWTPARFTAAVQNSNWFRSKSEQTRNALTMKASDPASYAASVAQIRTKLAYQASSLGAQASPATLDQLAESAYMFGWDDNQIQQNLATYVKYTDGRVIGQAAQWDQELRSFASDMGVTLSDSTYQTWIQNIASGTSSLDGQKGEIAGMASSAFPHLADRIKAGETLKTISDPYRQTMASLLEINPEMVGVGDPMIRQALQVKDPTTGVLSTDTLYDFENKVRADKRWDKTSNARDAASNTANKILSDMGLM